MADSRPLFVALLDGGDPRDAYIQHAGEPPQMVNGVWYVTAYADLVAIGEDPESFSAAAAVPDLYDANPALADDLKQAGVLKMGNQWPAFADPPRYQDVLNAATELFHTYCRGPEVTSAIRARAEMLAGALQNRDGGFDLLFEFAHPFTHGNMAQIVGVPQDRLADMLRYNAALLKLLDFTATPDDKRPFAVTMAEYDSTIVQLLDDRAHNPQHDLLTGLTQSEVLLSIEDRVTFVRGMFVAGVDTTATFIARVVLAALENDREIWTQLVASHDDTQTFDVTMRRLFNEVLRRDAPHRGLFRTAIKDTVINGVTIPAGSPIALMYGVGNWDAKKFPDPERLDINRENSRDHLAFGVPDMHHCIGQHLARAEAAEALRTLVKRFPDLRTHPDLELRDVPGSPYFRLPQASTVLSS